MASRGVEHRAIGTAASSAAVASPALIAGSAAVTWVTAALIAASSRAAWCAGNVGGGRYGQLMVHVEVRGKVPGADGDGLPDVLVELEAGATTVRELIRLAVGEQVRRLCGDAAR